MLLEITTILLCVLCGLFLKIRRHQSYWERLGVPAIKADFFFGNLKSAIRGKKNIGVTTAEVYRKFPNYKYVGFYKFLQNSILLRDPELIGNVLGRDFQHFADNEVHADENVDYIMAKNLFVMKGQEWKTTRSQLTPMFTSGKLKAIFFFVEDVSKQFVTYMNKEIDAARDKCVDGKELCTKFTVNNVATCAFGLDGKAFEGVSEFNQVVGTFTDQSYLNGLKATLIFMFPALNNILKFRLFHEKVETYLTDIVRETVKYRKENNIVRNDFLDQIYSLKEKCEDFTDRDVVAQSAGFFIDGVETSSIVMSYMLYEIARNPEIQKKLREEIVETKTITYETMNEMKYLDWVLSEGLRFHGPVLCMLKMCTKSYELPEINDRSKTRVTLNPGDSVLVPLEGIHMDPQYFSEPLKFIPERFADENKAKFVKNTYMPFGNGPRQCIALRFGMLQLKLGIIALVNNFEISVNPKMLPYEISPSSMAFLRYPRNGFWFDFKKLTKTTP